MAKIPVKNFPGLSPPNDLNRLKSIKPKSAEMEKMRLKKAAKEFESMVFYEMLKTMRKTIPENGLMKDGMFSGGMGKDIFTEMFDMQLAKKMTDGNNKNSVADILYRQLEKVVEAEFLHSDKNSGSFKKLEVKSQEPVELNKKNFLDIPRKLIPVDKKEDTKYFHPIKNEIEHDRSMNSIISKYKDLIDTSAKENSLDSALIASVIQVESNGNPEAVSPAGAKGLMQLMDSTASDYGAIEVYDPKENIEAGSRFLKDMMVKYGDLKLALAAYNAGPGNVDKYNGIPPYKETQQYVEKVLNNYNQIKTRM